MARYIDADKLMVCYVNVGTVMFPRLEAYVRANDIQNAITADVVPKSEVDLLKNALKAQEAESSQALQDKARECNMAIDKICLEHRAKLALLHSSHEQELAKAKREVAKIFEEIENLFAVENFRLICNRQAFAELKKKYTEGE